MVEGGRGDSSDPAIRRNGNGQRVPLLSSLHTSVCPYIQRAPDSGAQRDVDDAPCGSGRVDVVSGEDGAEVILGSGCEFGWPGDGQFLGEWQGSPEKRAREGEVC